MADRKISDLTALTTPASGDFLPIVDISEAAAASKNKRITIEELMRGVPDGTAAAPGIAFETDPNTGIYSPGADQLAVATNGVGRLFVNATGEILAGTSTSVDGNWKIQASAAAGGLTGIGVNNDGGYGVYLIYDNSVRYSGAGVLRNIANSPLAFETNNTERLRITSAGLVGIGTSAPLTPLAVSGGITGGNAVTPNSDIAFPSAANNGYLRLVGGYQVGTGTGGTIQLGGRSFSDSGNVGAFLISANTNAGFNTTDLTVSTQTSFNNVVSEKLRIDQFGRVGIGTTSPGTTLQVQDAAGFIQASGAGISFNRTSGTANYINTGQASGLLSISAADAITFGTSTTGTPAPERARIDSSGRLLVGTSSDSGGALLQVNGDRIRVGTAKTPATSGATGTTGEIAWDADYIYVCTATNTWKRSAIATW